LAQEPGLLCERQKQDAQAPVCSTLPIGICLDLFWD